MGMQMGVRRVGERERERKKKKKKKKKKEEEKKREALILGELLLLRGWCMHACVPLLSPALASS